MRLAKKSVHRSDGDAPNLCIRGLMADTVPIFTTRRLLPHSGRHLPPLPWLHPFDRPVSDTPPHQPQRRMADGRGHPAHLEASAFADGQPEPAVGPGFAEAVRRVWGPKGGPKESEGGRGGKG